MINRRLTIRGLSIWLLSAWIVSSSATTLEDVILITLKEHPDILAAKSRVTTESLKADQSKAGLYPTMDVSAAIGVQRKDSPSTRSNGNDKDNIERNESSLVVRQNVFKGFETVRRMEQYDHGSKARVFESLNTQGSIALKVAEVYIGVLEKRKQLELAENNRDLHEKTKKQITSLFNQGLASESDLAQISGRTSQSRAFVVGAKSELDRALSSYISVVNRKADNLLMPKVFKLGFKTLDQAMNQLDAHPLMRASQEQVNSADAAYQASLSVYYPSVNVEFTHQRSRDADGVTGHDESSVAKLSMSYNLYRGGADQALVGQAASQAQLIRAERQKTHRRLMLELKQAWYLYESLTQQKPYLQEHVNNSIKTLNAYTKQFDLGQRTLVDVLNTATELYQARKTFVRHEFDIMLSKYRLLNAAGQLMERLKLAVTQNEKEG